MTDDDARAIVDFTRSEQRQAAADTRGNYLAKVVSQVSGYFTLELPDGTQRKVRNNSRTQWEVDRWVTVETADGHESIVYEGGAQSE